MHPRFDLLVYGCGGHARSVIDVLVGDRPGISLCLVDQEAKEGELVAGFPVYREEVDCGYCFLAIGDNRKRAVALEAIHGRELVSIISSRSHIGRDAVIAEGVFVGNFVHIGPESVIGLNTIINNCAVVEHEVRVGAHCHVGPNTAVSGRSRLGDFVFIGVGATVIDSISICSDVVIGAGSVVIEDITEPGTYVGSPAKRIR